MEMELKNSIIEKVISVFNEEFNKPNFELAYLVIEDIILFFVNINEGKELSNEGIEKISSILDAKFDGFSIVNQEYRYKFNLNPCSD